MKPALKVGGKGGWKRSACGLNEVKEFIACFLEVLITSFLLAMDLSKGSH